ncbi:uncharacterized protein LOC108622356 isoform X2 [Ceratina calcarata]|uniref:Uncharacterized protein LOC108622356 isoform X2 n=1 Tax=Ceratina calcarata TaxID=156304 RepID=A0AAJ7W8T5_9HYME|nr:uncharacterized protein LOC108622356 isoform X2 [Ceratina calcarata]
MLAQEKGNADPKGKEQRDKCMPMAKVKKKKTCDSVKFLKFVRIQVTILRTKVKETIPLADPVLHMKFINKLAIGGNYTYSERSQCRYEIAPGILAMPNMSRPSIHSNSQPFSCDTFDSGMSETTDFVTAKGTTTDEGVSASEFPGHMSSSDRKSSLQCTKTHKEQYRSYREVIYTEPKIVSESRQSVPYTHTPFRRIDSRQRDVTSFIDSDTELDEAIPSSLIRRSKIIERFTSFISVIVSWFSKLLVFLRLETIEKREYRPTYEYQRNVAESKLSRVWKIIDRSFAYVYFFLVKVLLFDTWLLSCGSNARARIRKTSWRVLWIVLLPLLLILGYWCLPYFPMLLYSTKVIARQFRETSDLTANNQLISREMMFGKDIFESFGISNLDQTVEQSGQHFNESEMLEQLKESERVLSNIHTEEMDIIKLQLKKLRELYSELKLCCNARTKYITNEDLEMRLNMFLSDYLSTSVTNEAKVRSESSIAMDYGITDDRVRAIVREALKIYDADKTGRVDYALESAGGQIVSTRCTQRYDIKTRAFKLLAFTLYHENNNPRTVIQGNPIQPGTCWAFQGFPGYLLIKLRSSIYITGFTLEHAPKSILPNGEMRSAPKKFNVWGFLDENDLEPVMFGDYEFAASDDSLQYFPVQNITIDRPYEYVELRIHSNHGQLEYTCLYRFRVHGRPM